MKRNLGDSRHLIFSLIAHFLALFIVIGHWPGQSFAQQSQAPETKPAATSDQAPASQNQNPSEEQTAPESKSSGGARLSKQEVLTLPLNKRDFSALLLLAAGTMTDSNGAANFTQQFAVNGQRGVTTVFGMDGIDTTEPGTGRIDFLQFQCGRDSGSPLRVRGDAGGDRPRRGRLYRDHHAKPARTICTDPSSSFLRNSAFDSRNFFDERSPVSPGRLPHFVRNEFGFTVGGPFVIPNLYNGRKRTYFFGQYQGFRQVLGTTQILSVPTALERKGIDTTAFPGLTPCWSRSTPRSAQFWIVILCPTIPRDRLGPALTRRPRPSPR